MDRYGTPPTYPSYQMAQSLFGLKIAWEKAQAKKGGAKPTTEEVIAAFEGIEVVTPKHHGEARHRQRPSGRQDTAYGTYRFNNRGQAGGRRRHALSGRVREPARPIWIQLNLAQGRDEGREVLTESC